jgi:hypothetical protein
MTQNETQNSQSVSERGINWQWLQQMTLKMRDTNGESA